MLPVRSLLVLTAAVSLTACIEIGDFGPSDRYQEDFHYTYDLAPDGALSVESFNGSIEIAGWEQNKVEISGTKYASTQEMRDAIRIEVNHSPSSVEVRTVRPSSRFGNMGARFLIHVPNKARLDRITSSNGGLRVRDVANAAHLKTSNGGIRVENVAGPVEARTSNSSIDLDSVHGSAVMKTSNGRIRAENITGDCDAETSNNSISVRLDTAPPSPIRLITSNGSIDLTMRRSPKNDVRAETRNSSITVHLPASTNARISADTSNSSITSDFDVLTDLHDEGRKHHIDGVIGNGGPHIDLSTSNGHIRIVKGSGD